MHCFPLTTKILLRLRKILRGRESLRPWPAFRNSALPYPALTWHVLFIPLLSFPALPCPSLPFPALLCPSLGFPVLLCPLLCPSLTLHSPALPCTAHHCISLYQFGYSGNHSQHHPHPSDQCKEVLQKVSMAYCYMT